LIGFAQAHEVAGRASDLKKIEDLGAILEEKLILDNRLDLVYFLLQIHLLSRKNSRKNCVSVAGNFYI
jgi:hypothetical protein